MREVREEKIIAAEKFKARVKELLRANRVRADTHSEDENRYWQPCTD